MASANALLVRIAGGFEAERGPVSRVVPVGAAWAVKAWQGGQFLGGVSRIGTPVWFCDNNHSE